MKGLSMICTKLDQKIKKTLNFVLLSFFVLFNKLGFKKKLFEAIFQPW